MEASHFVAKLKQADRLFDAGQQYRAPKDAAVHVRFLNVTLSCIFSCLFNEISPDSSDHRVGASIMVRTEPEYLDSTFIV